MPSFRRSFDPFGGASDWRDRPRPRRVPGGLRARSRRGEFARTWWGRKWIANLEGFGWSERLKRGRSYARAGQVLGLRVTSGHVEARVQGSRSKPYRVRIAVRPLPETTWARVLRGLGRRAEVMAALLSGDLPESIESTFRAAGGSILPARDREIEADCNCPDWANPCKHIAAVHYLLAEAMDRDPFVLLTLRGRTREELSGGLRARATPRGPPARRRGDRLPRERPLASSPTPFWGETEQFRSLPPPPVQPPAVPDAVLRRLGEPAFLRGTPELVEYLRSAYDRIGERARAEAFARTSGPPGDPPAEARSPPELPSPPVGPSPQDAGAAGTRSDPPPRRYGFPPLRSERSRRRRWPDSGT